MRPERGAVERHCHLRAIVHVVEARYGVRVAAIAPGFIDTPILQGMRPEMLEKILKGVPLRRAGSCDEIFAGVKFIVECEYFTGKCLDIDGGLTL